MNISFILGFQEVSGIWARLGEKTATLLGNANLTVAMRQQDSGRTREWIEKTAGQTNVTQATSYQGSEDGNYREARHAEVRTVSRVDWNDLTSLIEGEAIVLFGGRRVYARVFHAQIDDKGPKRIGRSVMLSAPDHDVVRARADRLAELAQVIEQGALVTANGEEASPVLDALRDGFIAAAGRKASMQECAAAALAAVQALPESALPPRPAAPSDGLPVTAVTPMLKAAAQGPVPGPERKTSNGEMVDGGLCRGLIAIERLVGVPPIAARKNASDVILQRDEALQAMKPIEPPAMTSEAFCARLRSLLGSLRTLQASLERRAA